MMTLSEAIRLGASLRPQTRGRFHTPGGLRSCALGAALDAMGIKLKVLTIAKKLKDRDGNESECPVGTEVWYWPDEWASVFRATVGCPLCVGRNSSVKLMIPHLNDKHRWTRERIADFVRIVELRMAETTSETQIPV